MGTIDVTFTEKSVELYGPKIFVDWAEGEMEDKYLCKMRTECFKVNQPG